MFKFDLNMTRHSMFVPCESLKKDSKSVSSMNFDNFKSMLPDILCQFALRVEDPPCDIGDIVESSDSRGRSRSGHRPVSSPSNQTFMQVSFVTRIFPRSPVKIHVLKMQSRKEGGNGGQYVHLTSLLSVRCELIRLSRVFPNAKLRSHKVCQSFKISSQWIMCEHVLGQHMRRGRRKSRD